IERSFQMMVQVAGRAGRKNHQGHVLIQTFQPQHYIFEQVKTQEYKTFYLAEMQQRMAFGYPPFTRLVRIILRHKEIDKVVFTSSLLANELRKVFGNNRVLGPESPSIGRLRNKYIKHIVIKTENHPNDLKTMRAYLKNMIVHLKSLTEHRVVDLLIDIDPI
ncbi:MAG: primosomal protein N', partial [Bacteroidetes bacterium]|nr:primosomal protein N' [Bacteroidota bacterium]